MSRKISVTDLDHVRSIDSGEQAGIYGRGVSGGYLFMSAPSRPRPPVFNQFLTIENFEVNNYETNNFIDKMINQTVNNNQMNLVSVQAGDAQVNIDVNQAQVGSNALS